MELHYCSVCGKRLEKSSGPIGPVCLSKLKPKNLRMRNFYPKQIEYIKKHDIFKDDYNESGECIKDGQQKNAPTSTDTTE